MKLVQKFTLLYLMITFVVLVIGGIILFFTIRAEVDFEEALMLRERLERSVHRLEEGADVEHLKRRNIEVRELDMALPEIEFAISDTLAYHEFLQRPEKQVKVTISRKLDGKHYALSSYHGLVESDDIAEAVATALAWIILLLLAVTAVLSVLISKKILAPFDRSLKAIRAFQLKGAEPVVLPQTDTDEFQKLNSFLIEMMEKAQQDYLSLKEFAENASHEMQTPLAIIRGKLELLLDTPLNDEQARLIVSSQNALDKLSRMGHSLTLLTKIGNQEFVAPEQLNLSKLLSDTLFAFEELMVMKSIRLEKALEEEVYVKLHPVLADILIGNLLNNAIRHNKEGGWMGVYLTQKQLTIKNTGLPLEGEASEMFGRFKKGTANSDSIGLGLAIAKRICEQSGLRISYVYQDELHIITLYF